jgi:DNA-binding GntR family transcriptional regulator
LTPWTRVWERGGRAIPLPFPEARLERTLAGQVYQAIRQALLNGSLALGGKLSEREIADSLRVSRTPVREALRQLERDGLVINEPQRGTFVRTFTRQEAFEIYDLRALLESYAVRRVARLASPLDLGDLRASVESGYAAAKDRRLAEAMTSNDSFHVTLMRLARHELLQAEWGRVWSAVVLLRACGWHYNTGRAVDTALEHRAICDALDAGDADTAVALTDRHIRNAFEQVEGYLAALAGGGG